MWYEKLVNYLIEIICKQKNISSFECFFQSKGMAVIKYRRIQQ